MPGTTLTNINAYFDQEYVNVTCTGPEATEPCPLGVRQAVWVLHDDEQPYEYLCRQCGESVSGQSDIYGTAVVVDLD